MRYAVALAAAAGLGAAALGCGGSAPPAHPVAASVAPAPPPRPVCVSTEDVAPISHASGDEARAQFCTGPKPDQCYALDLATGALTRATPAPDAPPVHAEVAGTEVKVCTADACKPLPIKAPAGAPVRAATTGDGTVAVALLGDAEHGKGYAEVWDADAGKKTSTFKYAQGDYKCGEVRVIGPAIFVNASSCVGPTARGTLFTLRGRRVAAVGGREFGTYGDGVVALTGSSWAFLGENGNKIVVQDVVSGRVGKTYDVSALWRRDGEAPTPGSDPIGNPGESTLVKLSDGKLGVIAGSPANGSVAVVDLATGAVTVTRAPLCP